MFKQCLAFSFVFGATTASFSQSDFYIPFESLEEEKDEQDYVYPEATWATQTPDEAGFDKVKFQDAIKYFKSKFGGDQVSIIRNGYLVYRGAGSKKGFGLFSCTKSFTSTVLGLLNDDKKISVDDFAADHLSYLKSKYSKVQFRHFATMTSGYDASGGSYGPGSGDGSKTPFKAAAPSFAPGSHFAYWDDAMNTFGLALNQVLGGKSIADFFKNRIANKIQITKFSWKTPFTYNGKSINTGAGSSGGVVLNSEDLARFCYLMLRKGKWKNEQLVSEEWVENATRTVQVPATTKVHKKTQSWIANGHYGFNWWINAAPGEKKLWPDIPEDSFAARGVRGNFCVVVPGLDLVITRVGGEGTSSNDVLNNVIARVVNAAQ
jgi:CubicO group peptidase (beta-lactamase class C family)